jgi:hypothetical protein
MPSAPATMFPSLDEFIADLSYTPAIDQDIMPEAYLSEITHPW